MLDNWVKSAQDSVLITEWHYYDNHAVKPSTLTFLWQSLWICLRMHWQHGSPRWMPLSLSLMQTGTLGGSLRMKNVRTGMSTPQSHLQNKICDDPLGSAVSVMEGGLSKYTPWSDPLKAWPISLSFCLSFPFPFFFDFRYISTFT